MKKKLTFFQMMYCWMFVYLSFFKYKKNSPENFSCTMLSILRMMNIISLYVVLNNAFAFDNGQGGFFLDIIIVSILFILDNFLFFRRRNELLGTFMNYPQKKKLRGRTIFWIYIIVTLITFSIGLYFGGKVEKPILAI